MEKKLEGNYTRICELYWTSPVGNTSQNSRCTATYHPSQKLSKLDELVRRGTIGEVSDILLWTPLHGGAKAGQPARTYVQQFCADIECSLEDLQWAMNDRDGRQERFRENRASCVTWWWWYVYFKIYIFSCKYKLHLPCKLFVEEDLLIIFQSIIGVGPCSFRYH